jgi:hypothetical protein
MTVFFNLFGGLICLSNNNTGVWPGPFFHGPSTKYWVVFWSSVLIVLEPLIKSEWHFFGLFLFLTIPQTVSFATLCRTMIFMVDTPVLGSQTDWSDLSINFEELRWQISTHNFTVTLELEDELEVDVTNLLMYSLNVLCDIFLADYWR